MFGFGFWIYNGVFQNFLSDQMHAGPLALGQLEALREIPGLLAALMAGLLVTFAEARIAAVGLLLGGIGIGLSGEFSHYWGLVAITVFWSIGFHLYSSVAPAITLSLTRAGEGGHSLGKMQGLGSLATLLALSLAWGLSLMPRLHGVYRPYFWIAGVAIAISAGLCFLIRTHGPHVPRARLILRKEYGLFYLLTLLEGCRRQIFSIFASYTLIKIYHVPLDRMLVLQLINAILIWITAPQMGRIIDRIGERPPLMFYGLALITVFVGYATTHSVVVLCILFLLDNVLFSFSVGFTTYLHRIVRPGEMTPCLAMGVTMNHVAAVTVPVAGAYLWERYHNYQVPFWVGVAIAGITCIATAYLPKGVAPVTATN